MFSPPIQNSPTQKISDQTVFHQASGSSHEPRPGDILLFGNPQRGNRLISWITRSPYYHVGIYAGAGNVVEMRVRGVMQRDLRGREGAHYFVVIPAPKDKGAVALEWAKTQMGDAYDYADLVVIALDRVFSHLHLNYTPGRTYTCGEFVAVAFDKAGVRLLPDIALADTEPGDFGRLVPPGSRAKTFDEYGE